MIEERPDSSFASGPDFLGLIRPLFVRSVVMAVIGGSSRDNLARHLRVTESEGQSWAHLQIDGWLGQSNLFTAVLFAR